MVAERVTHTYLEDDLLWFIPFIGQLLENHSFLEFLKSLHKGDLTLTDGLYLAGLLSIFGFNFRNFVLVSLGIHFTNTILFYALLRYRIKLASYVSLFVALMYLSFYGHFHVYLWPLTVHHLIVIFFFFLIMFFYLKTDELVNLDGDYRKYYRLTLFLSFPASFQELSILIIPLAILIHILFTADNHSRLLAKYRLWVPLFIIFSVYQLIVLMLGAQGHVLSGFLEPLYEVFGTTENPLVILGVIAVFCLSLFLLKILIKKFVEKQPLDIFFIIFYRLSFLLLLIPQMVFLCLYLFLFSLESALSFDVLNRWQTLSPPSGMTIKIIGIVWGILMIFYFLRYMKRENRHLIIFIPLYAMAVCYLGSRSDFIFSRYLIYVSPFFCILFCLFWDSFLKVLPVTVSTRYKKGLCILLLILLGINLVSIKIRSGRTLLVDYHWSYDYIRIAHIIKDDIERKYGAHSLPGGPICISGIKDIPYKHNWENGILRGFDFQRFDPFRQTLASVFGGRTIEVIVHDDCVGFPHRYEIRDYIVFDKEFKPAEPFYLSFYEGLELLKKDQVIKAEEVLEKAVQQKPFLINFVLDSKDPLDFLESGRVDVIQEIYAGYYDGDEKMNYIGNMIQKEMLDYGTALALLSHMKDREGDHRESFRLLQESFLLISPNALLDYHHRLSFPDASIKAFDNFINTHAQQMSSNKELKPGVPIESYKGFNIIFHKDFYFGFPQQEGSFSLTQCKSGRYQYCFPARTKYQVRSSIDLINGNSFADNGFGAKTSTTTFDYKDFVISKTEDIYHGSAAKGLSFKTRSLPMVKLIIDTFIEL